MAASDQSSSVGLPAVAGRLTAQPASGRPLRVAVVGMGRVGARRAACVKKHPDLQLCATCDIDPSRAEWWPDTAFCTDYRELVRDDLDIVFVCTYNNAAPVVVVDALRHGKHVFCEKPPGRNVADIQRMIAAERANPRLKLKFGFNHRYHHSVMEAKRMVDGGQFGRILWLRGVYGKCGGIQFENQWRNDKNIAGGGILLDQGIHMLDLCRVFCGDFTEVKSLMTTSYWNTPLEDNAFIIMANKSGQVAQVHSSATQWKHRFSLEICLEDGYVNLNGILSSTRSYGEETLTFARKQFEDTSRAFGRPREETIYFDTDESWTLEIADFVEAIRTDRPIVSGNSEDSLRVMQLIEQIYGRGAWQKRSAA